jgi:hypothetical protein
VAKDRTAPPRRRPRGAGASIGRVNRGGVHRDAKRLGELQSDGC